MSCLDALFGLFLPRPEPNPVFEPEPRQERCPDCTAVRPSPQQPHPTGPEQRTTAARGTPALGIKWHLICKRHVLLSDGRYSPINLSCFTKPLPPSAVEDVIPLTRPPVYLPIKSAVDLCRHGDIHLPHTWMSCAHHSGVLFINWATGIVQAEQPEAEPWIQPLEMYEWPRAEDGVWERAADAVGRLPCVAVARADSALSLVPSEQDLRPIDARLHPLISNIIFSQHELGRRQTREQRGSAHLAALMGLRSFGVRIVADEHVGGREAFAPGLSEDALGSYRIGARGSYKEDARGIYVFPERMTHVRRRALLIACTYGSSPPPHFLNSKDAGCYMHTREEDDASELRGTVNDVFTMYNVLVMKRGWKASDIVVLTDASDRTELDSMKKQGVRIGESDIKSVALWLGRFMSGLDAESVSERGAVSNSLVLFMAGHGCQYKEAPGAVQLETDGQDEGFWTSSIRVGGSREQNSEYHCGVLLDNDINALVCRVMHSLPKTQLVMVIDCCHAGTMADLPFLLNKNYAWETDGEARKLEENEGHFPDVYNCSQGIVYSLAGSKDDKFAINAARSARSKSLANACGGDTQETGGAMTDAFASSGLATGKGSILDGIRHIQIRIQKNHSDWEDCKKRFDAQVLNKREEKLAREHSTGVKENGKGSKKEDEFPYIHLQEPEFASSHCCRIDQRPLFL